MSKFPGDWKRALANLLQIKGKYSSDSHKVVSKATQQARRDNLFKAISDIRELGFKIRNPENIRSKHIFALAEAYAKRLEEKTISDATIRNRFSHLRLFSIWIGKPGLVRETDYYFKGIKLRRRLITTESKSWTDKGIDPYEKIEIIRNENPIIAFALELQLLFGLRTKESLLFMPHIDIDQYMINVRHGSKGGKERSVPIETEEQWEFLEKLKNFIPLNESLVPKNLSYINFRRTYYRVLEKHGISKKDGVTAHGLRHEHLNNLYEQVTGEKTPVRGGNLPKENKPLDHLGRHRVSRRAGHSRMSIAGAYIGSSRGKPKSKS